MGPFLPRRGQSTCTKWSIAELAHAQFDTIRLRLLKTGTRVQTGRTFIRFHFPESYPFKPLLYRASQLLCALDTS